MDEIEHAARAVHHVEVELSRQALPQLERLLVEARVAGQHVIRADDGRVAADIAGSKPALFQHSYIGDAVLLGEVIGGREPMAAAADDHHVVVILRRRVAPGALPVLVAGECRPGEGEDRVFHEPVRAGRAKIPDQMSSVWSRSHWVKWEA